MASCSARTLGIRYADRLAMHEIDRYFDLSGEQDDVLGPKVKSQVAWLKREKLPVVIDRVEAYGKAWERGPTRADAIAVLDVYDALRVELALRLGKDVAEFLAGLSKDQVDHLEQRLAKNNEESQDVVEMDEKEFVERQRKRTIKQFEHWLGALSDEQEKHVLALVPPNRAEWLRFREERLTGQRNFLELIKRPAPKAEIEAKLVEWARDPYKFRGSTAERGVERRERMIKVLSATYEIATKEQRAHAREEIQDLADDLRSATKAE